MSSTEDCELQDLVKQTLEKTGSLSKIRAELRANIFLALEETGCFQGTNSKNQKLQNFLQKTDGALVLCLVQEFLECFGMSFTRSVLDPELASYGVHCSWKSREELIKQLNFPAELDDEKKIPLMHHILQKFRDQQKNVPSSTSHISNNLKTNSRWTNDRLLSSATGSSNVPIATITPEENELIHVIVDENKERRNTTPSYTASMADKMERVQNKSCPTSEKDSSAPDFCKPKSSLLGELPPLSTTTNSSKSSLIATDKSSKQMTKLKAMLIDSSYDTNASNITEDELLNSIDQEEMSDSETVDENLIGDLLDE